MTGTRDALTALGRADLSVANDLLAAVRAISGTSQLRSALIDNEADAAQKRALVEAVFGSKISADAATLLVSAASSRWSSGADFLAGVEDLGIRVAADATGGDVDIDAELFAVQRTVASDAGLELALGSKLGSSAAKAVLVDRLLAGKASPATVTIVRHLVQQPRGRRIGEMLRHAASVVADQRGFDLAMVTTAVPLSRCAARRVSSRGSPLRRAADASDSTRSSIPPSSAGFACRSATTSSTAASPAASAR